MSKRFGRRQKAKMRAQIERLEDSLERVRLSDQRHQEYISKLEIDIHTWAQRIQYYLGVHSSFNQYPKEVKKPSRHQQVPVSKKVMKFITNRTTSDSCKVEFMHRFCCVVKDIPDEYLYLIKLFEVDGAKRRTYFSISKKEFEIYGLGEDFIRYVGNRISKELVRLINCE